MIQYVTARVVETEEISPATFVTWYARDELAHDVQPGQFVMVQPREGLDPFLPRAFSYHRFRERAGERQFALLYAAIGAATELIATQAPGDIVRMMGPLGNGFRVRRGARNLLLVGGGTGIAPLVALADQQIEKGQTVVLLFGARAAEGVYPAELLPPEVEYDVATEDGSMGHRGLVTDLFEGHLSWADQTFACGPTPMFRSMAELVRRDAMRRSVQILMETEMACGTGICYGCAVFTKKGVRLCCKDGPRFNLLEVF